MTNFDKFCNYILEAYSKRVDVPVDGRSAPDRYNNPGGAYPKQSFEKFGMQGYGIIGGGHKIAKYPDLASGIAANIEHLRTMPIVGKTVGEARYYWVNGKFGGSKPITGMDSNQVITAELLTDPNWLAQWMRGTAQDEGFGKGGRQIDDNSFAQALNILQQKSSFNPSAQYASTGTSDSTPSGTTDASNQNTKDAEQTPYGGLMASLAAPMMTDFSPEAARNALKGMVGKTVDLVQRQTGKKVL